jgi:histidine triad (HIT) family protein
VREDERTIAFLDINPATRGHALVIPRAHAADIHDVDPEDLVACTRAARELARRVIDRFDADGVNLFHSTGEAASQAIFHFHLHVIPRYPGDGLRSPWDRSAVTPTTSRPLRPSSRRRSSPTPAGATCSFLLRVATAGGPLLLGGVSAEKRAALLGMLRALAVVLGDPPDPPAVLGSDAPAPRHAIG